MHGLSKEKSFRLYFYDSVMLRPYEGMKNKTGRFINVQIIYFLRIWVFMSFDICRERSMLELDFLVKPQWGIERWLKAALAMINEQEQQEIVERMDDLFSEGFPVIVEKNKVLYAHVFGMLAQLESLAVQVPLKFLSELKGHGDLEAKMRQQLVDEVFHTAVFLKIAHELSMPYAFPPTYEASIEEFCLFVTSEPDVRTVVIMLNLIGEGWIEQIFDVLHQAGIATKVFDVILEDEKRHVAEAELYQALGLPDRVYMQKKLAILEEKLITKVVFMPKNTLAMAGLIGVDGCYKLMEQINEKHLVQIAKLDLKPHYLWNYFMEHVPEIMSFYHDNNGDKRVELTPARKVLIAAWENPKSPTMSSEFSIDVTRLGFFEKKYPPDTILGISLQALSKTMAENLHWCRYICNNEIFEAEASFTSIVVKLPNHDAHLGMIFFKNCHEMSLMALSKHIKHELAIMNYCYEKTLALTKEHPELMEVMNVFFRKKRDDVFGRPDIASPVVSLSNVGPWGFERVTSPLLPGEIGKVTLTKIKRVQEYNHQTNQFETIDKMPVNVSVDHRVLDANMPLPLEMQRCFKEVCDTFERDIRQPKKPTGDFADLAEFKEYSDRLLEGSLDFGFRALLINAHQRANYVGSREPFDRMMKGAEDLTETEMND